MISAYMENDKSFQENISTELEDIKAEILLEPDDAVCGECKSIGSLVYYGEYERDITIIENDNVVSTRINLRRYRCSTCGRTHTLVPGTHLIPYGRYSIGFILHVLGKHIMKELTIRQIADMYQIAISTFCVWKKRFIMFYELIKGKLEANEMSSAESLDDIRSDKQISFRLYSFTNKYKFSFLQNTRIRKRPYIFVLSGYFISLSRGSP